MTVHILYAHPNPKSFNAAILGVVRNGLSKRNIPFGVSDLYQMKFDSVLDGEDFVSFSQGKTPPDIAAEQEKIRAADKLLFIYPIWWMSPPAILKGYIDRVFAVNFAYRYTDTGAEGLLKGKKAIVINTFGNFAEKYEQTKLGASIAELLHDGILGFCGLEMQGHLNLYGVPFSDENARKRMLDEVANFASEL